MADPLTDKARVRRFANLDSGVPDDEKLDEHLVSARSKAKEHIGEDVYDSIRDGTDADKQTLLRTAECLLTMYSLLPWLNLNTQGRGVLLSIAESTTGVIAGTNRFISPNEMGTQRKAMLEEANSILDSLTPPARTFAYKVGCKDE